MESGIQQSNELLAAYADLGPHQLYALGCIVVGFAIFVAWLNLRSE